MICFLFHVFALIPLFYSFKPVQSGAIWDHTLQQIKCVIQADKIALFSA